ncbi:MAG: hypothetical protein ACYS47_14755, partial [Planctomycetota bacterium]
MTDDERFGPPEEGVDPGGPPAEGDGAAAPGDEAKPPTPPPSEHMAFDRVEEERPSLSYWAIVTGQFGRNRIAKVSLFLLGGLFLFAVYAPLLSFRVPFVYRDGLRQTLREGDRIDVAGLTLTVTSKEGE